MENTFAEEFYRRVEMIKARAKKADTNITHLCRVAGVSRTTPERWEKRVPKSIAIIDQMMEALAEIERVNEAQNKAFEELPLREQQRLLAEEEERKREEERQRRERRNEQRRLSRQKNKQAE
ncbi:hypothetical protein MUA04_10765 [Enterobacteriaceae bacterium H11S18]|uniref:hypothetical protein n=1 Tax=Dryocola clanedunensis TaxID=2925396 RepID=UPI0022F0018C|nr:hypothetical protein [Dryocola clanedunensis]MCT4704536.1 hypothetical protein [Dryocola clanedunensis]MCT4710668.1 hypothetical protein [Dryocola clanedunensis]